MAVAQIDSRAWLKHYPPEIPATIQYREAPLFSLLEEAAAGHPDLPALRFHYVRMSYAELWAQAQRFAAALAELGIIKGDRVALMLPNCPQYVIAYYGTLRAGGVVAQVNPLYTPRELAYLLKDAGRRHHRRGRVTSRASGGQRQPEAPVQRSAPKSWMPSAASGWRPSKCRACTSFANLYPRARSARSSSGC